MKYGFFALALAGITLAVSIPGLSWAGNPGLELAQTPDMGPNQMGNSPPPPPPPAMMGGHGTHAPDMMGEPHENFARMCEDGDAHQAAMLAYAGVKLKITAEQKPAWLKFTQAAETSFQPIAKLCEDLKGKPNPVTLPEHLARAEMVMSAHLARIQTIRPALEEVYQVLTPEQRKIADRMLLSLHQMHGHCHDRGQGM